MTYSMKYTTKRITDKEDLSKGIRKINSLIKKHIKNEDYISAYVLQVSFLEDRLKVLYYLHCKLRGLDADIVNNITFGRLINLIAEETSLLHSYGKDEQYFINRINFNKGIRNAIMHQIVSNIDSVIENDVIMLDNIISKIQRIIYKLKKEYYA